MRLPRREPHPDALSPEKRDQILAGAASVFARAGYAGASMSQIAAEAGVSKGTLYNHFEDKAALFAAWVERECDRNLTHIFERTDPALDPAAALHDIGARMVRLMLSPAGLTIDRVMVSEAHKFPQLALAFYRAGPERGIAAMAKWLVEQTARGRLNVADPEFAAEQFYCLCQTRLVLRRKLLMEIDPPQSAIDHVVAMSVAMFLHAYGAVGAAA